MTDDSARKAVEAVGKAMSATGYRLEFGPSIYRDWVTLKDPAGERVSTWRSSRSCLFGDYWDKDERKEYVISTLFEQVREATEDPSTEYWRGLGEALWPVLRPFAGCATSDEILLMAEVVS